jgi:hypothetical protein
LRTSLKVGLVAAGYVGAFVVASLVVMLYVALTSGPDRQGAQGMYAFGDSMLARSGVRSPSSRSSSP